MPLLGLVKWRWNIIVPSSLFPLNLEGMRWNWNFVSSFRHKISKIPTMEWRFFPLCSILLHWIHFIPSLCINPKIARRSYFISIIFLILLYIKSYYQYGSLYFSSPFFWLFETCYPFRVSTYIAYYFHALNVSIMLSIRISTQKSEQ